MNKYSESNEKGDRGESAFEFVIRPYAVPHKIATSKDIGVDFLCEWKNGEDPTGIIFAVQVKYYPSRTITLLGTDEKLNGLDKYKISPSVSISSKTQEYWKLLGMPIYLFIVTGKDDCNLYYKRYTPKLERLF